MNNESFSTDDMNNARTDAGDETGQRGAMHREIDDAKERLGRAAEDVKREAKMAGQNVTSLLAGELDRRKAGLSDALADIAGRIRAGGTEHAGNANIAESAADMVQSISRGLSAMSVEEIAQRLSNFGRSNPAVFVGACAAAGVLAGRFVVARETPSSRQGSMGADMHSGEERFGAPGRSSYGSFGDEGMGESSSSGVTGASAGFTEAHDGR